MKTQIFGLLGVLCISAAAQEQKPAVEPLTSAGQWQTNYITAHRSFRRVGGQLYNVEKSILWKTVEGECAQVRADGIVLEEVQYHRLYERRTSGDLGDVGAFRAVAPSRRLISEQRVVGKKRFLRNYPDASVTTGAKIKVRALQMGTTNFGSETIELWDCGVVNVVAVARKID